MGTQLAQPTGSLPAATVDATSVLQHARAGDQDAFRQIVQQHQARLFGIALQSTGQAVDATALAQDVFIRLHAALPRIASPAHLTRWLDRTLSQQALEHFPRLALETTHEAPAVATDPGPEFTARVMARVELRQTHRARANSALSRRGSRRQRSSYILIGMVMAALLVTLLALWWSGGMQRPDVAAAAAPTPVTASQPSAGIKPSPVPGAGTAGTAITASSSRPPPREAIRRYTVIAMPLRHESQDPAARAPVSLFYAALLDELRRLPDLTLLVPGVTTPPTDNTHPADFLLAVTSLDATRLSSGGAAFRITDGPGARSVALSSRQWPVEIRIQPLGRPVSESFTSALQIGDANSASLAARQVEILRARVLPDVLIKQLLLARMRDGSLSGAERDRAASDLVGTQLRAGGQELDPADISDIVGQATAMSANQRAQLWRSLRGIPNPDLVEPLLDSLRRDSDETVRFEALATLATSHGTEPRVRAAIESTAREDSQLAVRMAARRALHGDSEWRNDVVKTLKDTGLPYAERLEPLLLAARSATTPAETASLSAIVNDEEVVSLLTAMVRDDWFGAAQSGTAADALGLLANIGRPATFDVVMETSAQDSRQLAGPGIVPGANPPANPAANSPTGPGMNPIVIPGPNPGSRPRPRQRTMPQR